MTNEEAIKKLKKVQAEFNGNWIDCGGINKAFEKAYQALEERPQDELTETIHRLNLLIGVLYSNQLISESDIEYIEDSIKELMKRKKNDTKRHTI